MDKAKECKGLSHREAAVLLECELEDENVFEDCIYVTKYHCDYNYKYNKCKFELSNKECLKNAIKNGIFKKGIYKKISRNDIFLFK